MDEKELQKLYDAVSQHFNIGDYNSFKSKMQTPEQRKSFYDKVNQEGFNLGDYDQYETRIGGVKKKDNSPSVASDGQSLSQNKKLVGSVQVGDIQKIPEEQNPVDLALQANELSKKQTSNLPTQNIHGEGGDVVADYKPDEQAQKQANDIYDNLSKQGINGKKLAEDLKDVPQELFSVPGYTKDEIVDAMKNNPQKYERVVAVARWMPGLKNAINDAYQKGDIDEAAAKAIIHDVDLTKHAINVSDNYEQNRQNIQSLIAQINGYGGDKKEKLLNDIGTEMSYVYGRQASDPNYIMANAGNAYNNNIAIAKDYLQDIHPDELRKYSAAFIKDDLVKDNPDAKLAVEEARKKLEDLGIQLQRSYLQEKLNPIYKEYQPLLQKSSTEGLTPEEQQKMQSLEIEGKPYQEKLNRVNQDAQETYSRYPMSGYYEAKNFAKEVIGDKSGFFNSLYDYGHHFLTKTGESVENTGKGIYDFAKEPSRSEEESQLRQAEILGEGTLGGSVNYVTGNVKPDLTPELKADIDKIKNDDTLSYDDKLKATTQLLMQRAGEWRGIPDQNLSFKKLAYGVSDMAAGLVPFMGLELLTGGGATAGVVRKFTSTLMSAAATSFEDAYKQGIEKGELNPYAYAARITAINSAAIALGGKADKIREYFKGQKTTIGDLVSKMSDEQIEAALKESPKALTDYGKALNAIKNKAIGAGKAIGSSAVTGFKDAAKINAFTTAGNIANDAISGELKSPDEYAKDYALETLKFGVFGTLAGTVGKIMNKPSDMALATLYDAAKNKDAILSHIDQKVQEGDMKPDEAAEIKNNIETASKIITKSPFFKSLDDKAKREYLYNKLVEDKNKETASSLPEKQAEKYDMAAQVAQHKNALLVEPKTDKQLEARKAQLEKSLIPEKDAEGKNIEIPQKEIIAAKAEIKAIEEHQEEKRAAIENENAKTQLAKKEESDNTDELIKTAKEGGKLGVFANMDNEGLLKMVAEQAQNITSTGEKGKPEDAEMAMQSTVNQFGKELVDAAIKKYPANEAENTKAEDWSKDVESTAKALDELKNKKNKYDIFQQKLIPTEKFNTYTFEYAKPINPKEIKEFDDYFYHETPSGKIAISDKKNGYKLVEGENKEEALIKFKQLISKQGGIENLRKVSDDIVSNNNIRLAEQYHDGSNPELVKAVEDLLGKPNENKNTKADNESAEPISTEGSSQTESQPAETLPAAEKEEDDKWTAIRQQKIKEEISGAKKLFESEPGRKWTQIQQEGLEAAAKEFPRATLYESLKAKVDFLARKYDAKEDYNPTAKDLAAIQEFKRQTESRISELSKEQNDDNYMQRMAINEEIEQYNDDLLNVAKASFKREAGTAFGFRQSESKMDENYGLQIRRMQLIKSKGGEPLTPAEMKWTQEMWDKEKDLMKQEFEAKQKQMQSDFDAKIEILKKEYEEKLSKSKSNAASTKEKTLSQKGKDVADKIRQLKLKGTKIDFSLGTFNLAIEGVAKLVEAGSTVAEAIQKLIDDKVIGFKDEENRKSFEDEISGWLNGKKETSSEVLDRIKKYTDESNDTTITNDMVKKGLIRDLINSYIGEVDQKGVLKKAMEDLRAILPDATKENLLEAFLRKGDYRQETKREISEQLKNKKSELKRLAKSELTEDQQQKIKLEEEKKKIIRETNELQRKLDEGDYSEPESVTLKKEDAELIRLKKDKDLVESEYRKKQNELREKSKHWMQRSADFIRSAYITALIGKPVTLLKVAYMSFIRPMSEASRKLLMGKVFDTIFPKISEAAKRGGESSNLRTIKKGFEAYFAQMGQKRMTAKFEKAEQQYKEAADRYKNALDNNADEKTKAKLKQEYEDALIKANGNIIYQFIGGSSIKDAMQALVNRSNEIERQFGKVDKEQFDKEKFMEAGGLSFAGMNLDNINYVLGFIGRSHSAAKTFSGRFSYAAAFMARLEAAAKDGSLGNPDRVLEIAHESYLDWERGKYQQPNWVTEIWNKGLRKLEEKNKDNPEWNKYGSALNALLKTEVAITRVPVNIIHEQVMEYALGAFRAPFLAYKEYAKARKQAIDEGYSKAIDSKEFKDRVRELVSSMDEKQAAKVYRLFTKGGLGMGLYALALMTGMLHFGVFPHKGQKKKKDEEELGKDELNPGQIMIGNDKLGETASKLIEHSPALWPTFMGLGIAQIYNDDIKKGKRTPQAVWDAIYTHLKVIEDAIPQTKIISPTQTIQDVLKKAAGTLSSFGMFDKTFDANGNFINWSEKEKIKNYNEDGRAITDKEFEDYLALKKKKTAEKLKSLYEKPYPVERDGEIKEVKFDELTNDERKDAISKAKSDATKESKEELFGKKHEDGDKKQIKKELRKLRKEQND